MKHYLHVEENAIGGEKACKNDFARGTRYPYRAAVLRVFHLNFATPPRAFIRHFGLRKGFRIGYSLFWALFRFKKNIDNKKKS